MRAPLRTAHGSPASHCNESNTSAQNELKNTLFKRNYTRVSTVFSCYLIESLFPPLTVPFLTTRNLYKPMAAIQAFSPKASLCFSASPKLPATRRSGRMNNTNIHHDLKLKKENKILHKHTHTTVSHQVFLLLGFHGEVRGARLQRGVFGAGQPQPCAAAAGDHQEQGSGSDHGPGGVCVAQDGLCGDVQPPFHAL